MKYIAKALLFLAVVVVAVNASCGNNCSAHGTCSNDVCVCTTGWGGDDCSIWDHEIQSGGTDSGHLATFEWRYYHVSLPNGANGITVSVTQTSNFGDIDLFVARDYYPNIQQFSFEDTSTGTQLEVNINPVAAGTWYIGIYGYWSADYEITIDVQFACTVDCGPHGFCDGSVCACYDPYTSEDCSIYDESIESGQSISNTVASGEWKYFNIDVQIGDSMTLTLTQETTRYDLDVYIAANRYPTARNFDYLNATTMQTTEMHLTNLASGHYEIGIFGYHGGNFNLVVTVSHVVAENCENSCSTHGSCAGDVCSCYNGYSGNYCETYGPNIALGEDYSGYVESGKWNYWHLHYFTQSSMRINVAQTTPGDCDLYVRQNIDPSRINYQYTDLTLNMDFSITIQHPGDETWHIGVYGWTGCSYTLSAEILDDCQCTQESNGSCQEGSTQCICQLGYAGPLCTIPAPSIANGQVLSEQSVAPHSWKYYHFTSDSSAVFITMVETSTSGELFLTASLSGYPSGENFEYYDIAESDFHEIQIVWTSQRTPRTYFIGVLTSSTTVATEPVEFSITAFGTPF